MKAFVLTLVSLVCFCFQSANAECRGKVDLGGVYVRVDVIESNRTIQTLDMGGFRGDASVLFYKGFCLKPSLLMAWDKDGHHLYNEALGLGHYIPISKELCVLPSIGIACSQMTTELEVELFGFDFSFKERFSSFSPYIGLDITYSIGDCFLITGVVQYAWARTHTHIKGVAHSKGNSSGPNLGLLFDYYLNQQWSVNLGVGYNSSLSKEKHGLRAKGIKAGVGYWF